jgi:hypothetical protein
MDKKPSDVNVDKKISKRELMKRMGAAGIPLATAANLSVDEVRAADSDEVAITVDTEGEDVRYVDSTWYDNLRQAEKVQNKMRNRMNREGVVGIHVDPGDKKGTKPHIVVTVPNNGKGERERGRTPERKDGVRVRVVVRDNWQTTGCSYYDNQSLESPLAGGAKAVVPSETDGDSGIEQKVGTITPYLLDNSYNRIGYTTTAYHVVCDRVSDTVSTNQGMTVGTVDRTLPNHDLAVIKPASDIDMDDKHYNVGDMDDEKLDIDGTLNRDGVSHYSSEGIPVSKFGYGSCGSEGQINQIGVEQPKPGGCLSGPMENQVRWGSAGKSTGGDSGAITMVPKNPDKNDRKAYAVSQVSGTSNVVEPAYGRSYVWGVGGYALRNILGYWWGNN